MKMCEGECIYAKDVAGDPQTTTKINAPKITNVQSVSKIIQLMPNMRKRKKHNEVETHAQSLLCKVQEIQRHNLKKKKTYAYMTRG